MLPIRGYSGTVSTLLPDRVEPARAVVRVALARSLEPRRRVPKALARMKPTIVAMSDDDHSYLRAWVLKYFSESGQIVRRLSSRNS